MIDTPSSRVFKFGDVRVAHSTKMDKIPAKIGVNMLPSLFTVVLSSDNSILCFRQKAFLKSDMLAGFTTSVALIWYLTCVI